MSNDRVEIPRHGNAGSSFFGAEFKDSWIFLLGLLAGLVAGRFNAFLYIAVPGGAYMLNREYLQWLASGPPGRLRMWLYALGIKGYSAGHKSPDVVFVGDARGANLGASDMLDVVQARRAALTQRRVSGDDAQVPVDIDALLREFGARYPEKHSEEQTGGRHGA